MMTDCLIGLGSNLDDRAALLSEAVNRLCDHPRVRLVSRSRWYETAPVGGPSDQGPFLNGAVRVATDLGPREMLDWSLHVEQQMGRRRIQRWAERRIDIDLLLYDQQHIDSDDLQIPHPRMAIRRFVLLPATEIAGEMIHPDTGWTLQQLLNRLDQLPRYMAVAGIPGARKAQLVDRLKRSGSTARIWHIRDPLPDSNHMLRPGIGEPGATEILRLRQQIERWLEFARRSTGEPRAAAAVGISDFWLPQCRAVARALLDTTSQQKLEARWAAAESRVPIPHVTVFLDTPIDAAWQHLWPRGAPAGPSHLRDTLVRIHTELLVELQRPGQGPVLRIVEGDLAAAQTECLAAMDSMQELSDNQENQ